MALPGNQHEDRLKEDRWRQIQDTFHAARELPLDQRVHFLTSTCKNDAELRAEVESLLRASEDAGTFLQSKEQPIPSQTQKIVTGDPLIGKQIGPYRVIERIGAGGMGLVYRAEDIRLGRGAALKFLSRELEQDPQARERFEREARAASALNHSNICTIYGVDEWEGHPFLAMELLKGQTLNRVIAAQSMDVNRLLNLAIPIVSALEAAHGEGIIHRDIKPANIFLTDKGQVKVLDFGLAKQTGGFLSAQPEGDSVHDAETESLTSPGMAVGTVSYMSPEQARGERLDARSDLFSFGAVLYEMATGQRAFPGKVPILICEAILNRAPEPPSQLNSKTPGKLEAIITKALEKHREQRYQNASDLHSDLENLRDELKSPAREPSRSLAKPKAHNWITPIVLLLLLASAAGIYSWKSKRAGRADSSGHTTAVQIPARPSVAVLGFENLTARPEQAWLSTAFAEMLSTELAAGGRLRTIPGENVARARKELVLGEAHTYSKETLAKIRNYLGADYVVTGSYLTAGQGADGELRLDLRLQDARSGEVMVSMPETGTEGKLIELVSQAGSDLRAKLGIGDIPGAEITRVAATVPKNVDAARLYLEGLDKLRELNPGGARTLLQKAAAAEPQHPLIHAALAEAWSQLGYDEKSRAEARLAASLSERLPQSDQLWVEGRFRESTHEWDKAVDVYRTLVGFYPDNIEYGLRLASAQSSAGKQKDALETISKLRSLPPPANSDPRIDLVEADADEISGNFKHEKELAARALTEARNRGASLLGARAQYAAAWAALNLGEMADAARFAEVARATYIAAGDRNGEANLVRMLGTVHLMKGELSSALTSYQDSLALARKVGNRYSEAAALNQIATTLQRQGNHDTALKHYQESLAIIHEIGNRPGEGTAANNIANILWSRGDLTGARHMYDRAVLIAQELGDRSSEAGSTVNIAHILFQQGDLKGAREKIDHAIPLAQQIGEQSILAEALNSLGDVLLAQANFTEAPQQYAQSLSLRQTLGEKLGLAETQMSTAELLLEQGRPSEAEKLLHDALDAFQKENSKDDEVTAAGLLARSLLDQGKAAEARSAVSSVRAQALKIENPYARLNFLIDAARVDAFSGRFADSQSTLDSVLNNATELGFLGIQFKARLALGDIEHKRGDATKARTRLAVLQQDTSKRGFLLIARKASAFLAD